LAQPYRDDIGTKPALDKVRMTRKIDIQTLPVSAEFLPEKRLIQERGELALIEDGKNFRHLAYFSLRKGKGLYRGGHYHSRKIEHFYVVKGKLKILLVDLETEEREEVEARAGQKITIFPKCAHRFEAEEEAQVIEYYDLAYDQADDIAYDDF
jgi:dTDP-4-dehydrorhamnose 3,5-epimerase-like enzyme